MYHPVSFKTIFWSVWNNIVFKFLCDILCPETVMDCKWVIIKANNLFTFVSWQVENFISMFVALDLF